MLMKRSGSLPEPCQEGIEICPSLCVIFRHRKRTGKDIFQASKNSTVQTWHRSSKGALGTQLLGVPSANLFWTGSLEELGVSKA